MKDYPNKNHKDEELPLNNTYIQYEKIKQFLKACWEWIKSLLQHDIE